MIHQWRGVIHWSAGSYNANAHDKESYNYLVTPMGQLITGVPVDAQIPDAPGIYKHPYAAHVKAANGYTWGISMLGMAFAIPTSYGKYPLTLHHWDATVAAAAQLCKAKAMVPSRANLVGHCEVEKLWGVPQEGKWDPWQPFPEWKPRIGDEKDPFKIGDIFRSEVAVRLQGI